MGKVKTKEKAGDQTVIKNGKNFACSQTNLRGY
jgi:hypothetical protein